MIIIKIDILILSCLHKFTQLHTSLCIVRALSKYGMSNFTLAILEFTDEISVISREQKYINRFKPEYNLNPLAGNFKGYKLTPESIEKNT